MIELIANCMIVVAWLGVLAFVFSYYRNSPWKQTLIGRTIMYKAGAMLALLSLGLASNWLDGYPGEQWIRLLIYGTLAIVQWRLFMSLLYIQKGLVTYDNPNYTPVRNFLTRFRKKTTNVTEEN